MVFTSICAIYVLTAGYWGVVMADFQQGLIHLPQARALDLHPDRVRHAGPRLKHRRSDTARRNDVIVLDEHPVVEPHPVVFATPKPDGLLLQFPP